MKKVLITGSLGQIGTELTERLRKELGKNNVIATDIRQVEKSAVIQNGLFEQLDVQNKELFLSLVKKYQVDTIIHLASLLSATAENKPQFAWELNMNGLLNGLEIAKETKVKFFSASSIAVFGEGTPSDNVPQDTIMRPSTMYGITKVSGELLADYYYEKYQVDTRSIRFPGLISYKVEPGGGTTDYAVDIYYEAIRCGVYKCFIEKNTYMDMMYIDDAIQAIIDLMNADSSSLIHRNSFNVSAMSFCPEDVGKSIQKYLPEFQLEYEVDPLRQSIAETWPNSLDTICAKSEWGFQPKYNLDQTTKKMLKHLREKLNE